MHHHDHPDDHVETPVIFRPVPEGFSNALSDALSRTMPRGVVSSIVIWEGLERVGINFRRVADRDRAIEAVSEALEQIDTRFDYLPGIDISIWQD